MIKYRTMENLKFFNFIIFMVNLKFFHDLWKILLTEIFIQKPLKLNEKRSKYQPKKNIYEVNFSHWLVVMSLTHSNSVLFSVIFLSLVQCSKFQIAIVAWINFYLFSYSHRVHPAIEDYILFDERGEVG